MFPPAAAHIHIAFFYFLVDSPSLSIPAGELVIITGRFLDFGLERARARKTPASFQFPISAMCLCRLGKPTVVPGSLFTREFLLDHTLHCQPDDQYNTERRRPDGRYGRTDGWGQNLHIQR